MSNAVLPPTTESIIDNNRFPTLPWLSFFEGLLSGDTGTIWTPTFVNLTEVGTATKTGIYYRLSQKIVYFAINIVPGTSTSATAGSTYCNNFPITIRNAGASCSIIGSSAALAGVTASDKRIYTGTWVASTSTIVLAGILEV